MRLRRVELLDWRAFVGGPHAVDFDPRITVLAGPNEVGKSSVFEAIRRALFDRSKTSARWVARLVPYGVKGALPTVTLEVEHGGRTLRIRKSFGARGEAELSELLDGTFRPLARHEEAEEMLLDLLGADASTARDGSKPPSWGAFQWLFVPQDSRALPEPKSEAAGRLGLEHAGVSPEFDAVRSLLRDAWGRTFTATGKDKAGSERVELRNDLERLRAEREELAVRVDELDEARRQYEDVQAIHLPGSREDADQAKREWDEVQAQAVDLSGARGQVEAAEADASRCQAVAEVARAVLKERRRRERAAEEAQKALANAVGERATKAAVRDQIAKQHDEVRALATQVGDSAAEGRRSKDDAEMCLQIRVRKRDLEAAVERLDRARKLDESIREASAELAGDPPDSALVKKAEDLWAEARAKRASARRVALRVRIEGAPGLVVSLDGEPLEGSEGVALEEVVVASPAGGAVRVAGDTREAQRLTDEAEGLERDVAALLAPFGAASVEALRELRDERLAARAKLDTLEAQRRGVDERPTPAIEASVATSAAGIREMEARRAAGTRKPEHDAMPEPGLEALVRRLAVELSETEKRFEEMRRRRDELARELEAADDEATRAAEASTIAETTERGVARELDRHRDEHGGSEKCFEAQADADRALEAATARLADRREALDRLARDAEGRLDQARRKYERLAATVQKHEARAQQLREDLERKSAEGTYTRAAEIDRRIESEEARLARLDLEARALDVLAREVDAVRDTVVSRVVAPIKEDLDRLLAAATTGRYTLASLGDALLPERLDGARACEFEDGSEGLRELVSTLVRMAVASHLAKSSDQVLVLDDPCVHVSRERTRRLVELLNDMTRDGRIQVVVLTHRENEFAGLAGRVVDLSDREALRSRDGP